MHSVSLPGVYKATAKVSSQELSARAMLMEAEERAWALLCAYNKKRGRQATTSPTLPPAHNLPTTKTHTTTYTADSILSSNSNSSIVSSGGGGGGGVGSLRVNKVLADEAGLRMQIGWAHGNTLAALQKHKKRWDNTLCDSSPDPFSSISSRFNARPSTAGVMQSNDITLFTEKFKMETTSDAERRCDAMRLSFLAKKPEFRALLDNNLDTTTRAKLLPNVVPRKHTHTAANRDATSRRSTITNKRVRKRSSISDKRFSIYEAIPCSDMMTAEAAERGKIFADWQEERVDLSSLEMHTRGGTLLQHELSGRETKRRAWYARRRDADLAHLWWESLLGARAALSASELRIRSEHHTLSEAFWSHDLECLQRYEILLEERFALQRFSYEVIDGAHHAVGGTEQRTRRYLEVKQRDAWRTLTMRAASSLMTIDRRSNKRKVGSAVTALPPLEISLRKALQKNENSEFSLIRQHYALQIEKILHSILHNEAHQRHQIICSEDISWHGKDGVLVGHHTGMVDASLHYAGRLRREAKETHTLCTQEMRRRGTIEGAEERVGGGLRGDFVAAQTKLALQYRTQQQNWQQSERLAQCSAEETHARRTLSRDASLLISHLISHCATSADTLLLIIHDETTSRDLITADRTVFDCDVTEYIAKFHKSISDIVSSEESFRAQHSAEEDRERRHGVCSFSRPLAMLLMEKEENRMMEQHAGGHYYTREEKRASAKCLRWRALTRAYVAVTVGPAASLRDEYKERLNVETAEHSARTALHAYRDYFFWLRLCSSEWLDEPPPLPSVAVAKASALTLPGGRRRSTADRIVMGYLENVLLLQNETKANSDYFCTPPHITLLLKYHRYAGLVSKAEGCGVAKRLSGLELLKGAAQRGRKQSFSEQQQSVAHGAVAAVPKAELSSEEVDAWKMKAFMSATRTGFLTRESFALPEVERAEDSYAHSAESQHSHILALSHSQVVSRFAFTFPASAAWTPNGCTTLCRAALWGRKVDAVVRYALAVAACVPFVYISRLPELRTVQRAGRGAMRRVKTGERFHAPKLGLTLLLSCMPAEVRGSSEIAKLLCRSGTRTAGEAVLRLSNRLSWAAVLLARCGGKYNMVNQTHLLMSQTDAVHVIQRAARVAFAIKSRSLHSGARLSVVHSIDGEAAVQEKVYSVVLVLQRIGRGNTERRALQDLHHQYDAACHVQKIFRGFAARNLVLHLAYKRHERMHQQVVDEAGDVLQGVCRGYLSRLEISRKIFVRRCEQRAVHALQRIGRGCCERHDVEVLHWKRQTHKQRSAAATSVQRIWRGFLSRNASNALHHDVFLSEARSLRRPILQKVGLGHKARHLLSLKRRAVLKQHAQQRICRTANGLLGRMSLGTQRADLRKRSAIAIQRLARGFISRRTAKRIENSCITIQSTFRGFTTRLETMKLEHKLQSDVAKEVAGVNIQRVFRGYISRLARDEREYARYVTGLRDSSSRAIQRAFRVFAARRIYEDRAYTTLANKRTAECATHIQRTFRGYATRTSLLPMQYATPELLDYYHRCAIVIQCAYRGSSARHKTTALRELITHLSVLKLQKAMRGGTTRKQMFFERDAKRLANLVMRLKGGHEARRVLYRVKHREDIVKKEESVAVLQRVGRGTLAKGGLWRVWGAENYERAACAIQRRYRVFCARGVLAFFRARAELQSTLARDSEAFRAAIPIGCVVTTQSFDDAAKNNLRGRVVRWQHPNHVVLCMMNSRVMSVVPMHCVGKA